MKNKFEIGKYYDHNPNHFRFPRTYDMGCSYVSSCYDNKQNWIEVIFGYALVALFLGVLYYFDCIG